MGMEAEAEQRCQASFGLVSHSVLRDIAGTGPQQIEIAAHVAYGVVANLEANISHVGLRK